MRNPIEWLEALRQSRQQRKEEKQQEQFKAEAQLMVRVASFEGQYYVCYDGIPLVNINSLAADVADVTADAWSAYVRFRTLRHTARKA